MLQAVAPINYGNIVSGSGSVPTSGSYFYARFTGLLVPLVTGQYTVGVNCQDGCNLFIGEQALVSNLTNKDTAYGAVEYTESGTIYLSAGLQYPITLEWAVGVGGASVGYELQLIWTPPATSTPVLIPATCLTNDTTSITGVLDSSWWNGTLALYYPTGNAAIDFANTQHFNKTLDYISDGLARRILGGSGGFSAATAATATANVATAPADDVIIADGHGNVEDSGVLLSSLVTASELSSYGFFVNPMTASGDMIYEDPSLGPMRLPIGAEGYVMTVVSGLPAWTAGGGGGFANPMTTEGDMIYENASLVPTRLPIGTNGYQLTVVAGLPAWTPAGSSGFVEGPASVPNCKIWCAADQLSGYTNGDPVPSWKNLIESGPGLGSYFNTNVPVYQTGILNSLPAIFFDGTGWYDFVMPELYCGTVSTFVMVIETTSLSNAYTGIVTTKSGGWAYYVKSTGKTAFYTNGNNYDGAGSYTFTTSGFQILTVVFGPQGVLSRIAGSTDYSSTSISFQNTSTGFRASLGADEGAGGRILTGYVAEFLAYPRAITAAEITALESYLNTKWGL